MGVSSRLRTNLEIKQKLCKLSLLLMNRKWNMGYQILLSAIIRQDLKVIGQNNNTQLNWSQNFSTFNAINKQIIAELNDSFLSHLLTYFCMCVPEINIIKCAIQTTQLLETVVLKTINWCLPVSVCHLTIRISSVYKFQTPGNFNKPYTTGK